MPTDKKEKPYCKNCAKVAWATLDDGTHVKSCGIKNKAIDSIKKDEMRKCSDFVRI